MLLSYAGYYGYGRMYYDPTMILALIGLVLTIIASSRVNATFAKYNKVRCMAGLTGAQAAEKVLHMAGIYDVRIEHVSGSLTDHYDPRDKVLRLSDSTYGSTSVAAVCVAAHECGHAIQDKDNYLFLRVRSSLVPITNFATNAGYFIIMFGFIFSMMKLVVIGIILDVIILLFQVITLPVEFNASHRALIQLKELDLVDSNEQSKCRGMLVAAALTYVAAVATAILEILRLVLILRNDDDR